MVDIVPAKQSEIQTREMAIFTHMFMHIDLDPVSFGTLINNGRIKPTNTIQLWDLHRSSH
jgi:hypothetical protein